MKRYVEIEHNPAAVGLVAGLDGEYVYDRLERVYRPRSEVDIDEEWDSLVDTPPKGYKPVKHKACDDLYCWVKESVQPGDRMYSDQAMFLDGTVPEFGSRPKPCPSCGVSPSLRSLTIE